MSSTPRVPKAEITGLFGYALKWFSRKMLGEVPEPAGVQPEGPVNDHRHLRIN